MPSANSGIYLFIQGQLEMEDISYLSYYPADLQEEGKLSKTAKKDDLHHPLKQMPSFLCFLSFFYFLAVPEVCGSSQTRERTGATAAPQVAVVTMPDP